MEKAIGDKLLGWYKLNKRDLPWRKTSDPYLIWVSEIILQQTRVDQGTEYYLKFIKRFPNIVALAEAKEQEVLKYWQGLGYYSRARNMHKTAKQILETEKGAFPSDYHKLLKLKGIGPYTAAAIASIAYNKPFPVIDGNVNRVISRLYGIQKAVNTPEGVKLVSEKLKQIFKVDDPGNFNQAIMEIGALVCKPINPDCEHCVLKKDCVAFRQNKISEYPLKIKASAPQLMYLYYFVVCIKSKRGQLILLNKREGNSIWKNMYDFPGIESKTKRNIAELCTDFLKKIFNQQILPKPEIITGPVEHQLTHRKIKAFFIKFSIDEASMNNHADHLYLVKTENLGKYPLPKLIENYLRIHLFAEKKSK